MAGQPRAGIPSRLERNIGFLASRFSHVTSRVGGDILADFGLSTRLYSVLELAASDEGMSQRDIGRLLGIDPSHVLRMVDQLAEMGYIERTRDTADRRVTTIRATAKGRVDAAAAARALESAYDELLSGMPAADRADLRRLLLQAGAPAPR